MRDDEERFPGFGALMWPCVAGLLLVVIGLATWWWQS